MTLVSVPRKFVDQFRSNGLLMVRHMSGQFNLKNRLTPSTAVKWVNALSPEERQFVLVALNKKIRDSESAKTGVKKDSAGPAMTSIAGTASATRPTNSELYRLAIQQGLPFVGFGFLDNFIMIVAGESIETFLGASLVISTMAAAALGNTLSDVFGIGSAWYVEYWLARLGWGSPPPLTIEQLEMSSSRIAANGGRALGVTIGCLLGMFPLLFFKSKKKESEDNSGDDQNVSTTKDE